MVTPCPYVVSGAIVYVRVSDVLHVNIIASTGSVDGFASAGHGNKEAQVGETSHSLPSSDRRLTHAVWRCNGHVISLG